MAFSKSKIQSFVFVSLFTYFWKKIYRIHSMGIEDWTSTHGFLVINQDALTVKSVLSFQGSRAPISYCIQCKSVLAQKTDCCMRIKLTFRDSLPPGAVQAFAMTTGSWWELEILLFMMDAKTFFREFQSLLFLIAEMDLLLCLNTIVEI